MFRRSVVLMISLLATTGTAVAQEPDIVFEVVPHSVTSDTVSVSVLLSFPPTYSNVSGWSFALCHDPSDLQLQSWEWGEAAATAEDDGGPPWLNFGDVHPGGITQAVLLGGHFGGVYLSPGTSQEMLRVHYTRISSELEHEFSFCELGLPPVDQALVSQGQSFTATTVGLVIDLASAFSRGDCNADGNQDLADSIFLEQYLFLGGDEPTCFSACDVNDDGLVNIADSITNLSYLFVAGAAPPPPFGSCGSDPTLDDLICLSSSCP